MKKRLEHYQKYGDNISLIEDILIMMLAAISFFILFLFFPVEFNEYLKEFFNFEIGKNHLPLFTLICFLLSVAFSYITVYFCCVFIKDEGYQETNINIKEIQIVNIFGVKGRIKYAIINKHDGARYLLKEGCMIDMLEVNQKYKVITKGAYIVDIISNEKGVIKAKDYFNEYVDYYGYRINDPKYNKIFFRDLMITNIIFKIIGIVFFTLFCILGFWIFHFIESEIVLVDNII